MSKNGFFRYSYYRSHLLTEQLGTGDPYSKLKPAKSIIVADFDFVPESEKCHTIFQTLEKDEHFPFNDLEEIHVLSLKKLSRLDNERLREWLRFINSESKEEFMELAGIDPVFVKAVDVLATFSADDYNRMLYEARLKEWRDNKSRIDGAYNDGMKKVFSLLRQGYSIDEAEKLLAPELRRETNPTR